MLNLANRTRKLLFGYNGLLRTSRDKIGFIFIWEGVSENSKKKILKHVQKAELVYVVKDKAPGSFVGREGVKILGVLKSNFSDQISKQLKKE